jgi:predicted aldo/keto reductase-like oxidoreductase
MFPINFVEYFTRGFGKEVLDLANQQGAAVISIKPMSRGTWAQGAERSRKWWYQPVEDPKELDLALRFAWSLKGVVSGVPPSYIDLVDRAVEMARVYRELTLPELNDLVKLAWECGSLFKREEERVAVNLPYPHHPHDEYPGALA